MNALVKLLLTKTGRRMAVPVPLQRHCHRSLGDGLFVEEEGFQKSILPLLLPEGSLGSSLQSLSRQGFQGSGKGSLVKIAGLANRCEGAAGDHSSCPPTFPTPSQLQSFIHPAALCGGEIPQSSWANR